MPYKSTCSGSVVRNKLIAYFIWFAFKNYFTGLTFNRGYDYVIVSLLTYLCKFRSEKLLYNE